MTKSERSPKLRINSLWMNWNLNAALMLSQMLFRHSFVILVSGFIIRSDATSS